MTLELSHPTHTGASVSAEDPTRGLPRRTVMAGAAWGIPAVTLLSATPAMASTSGVQAVSISGPAAGIPATGDATITVLTRDAQGQPLSRQPVSLTGPEGSSFGASDGVTDGSGQYSTTFSLGKPWVEPGSTITLTAVSASNSGSQSFTVLGANALGAGADRRASLGVFVSGADDGPSSIATPTQLNPVFTSPVVQFASNRHNSLALLRDGTVWGIGENNSKELSSTAGVVVPWRAVSGVSSVTQIAICDYSSAALLSDGSVMAWGRSGYGQLGDGSGYGAVWDSPRKINELANVKQIGAGMSTIYALMADGTVRGCGWNGSGQVGNGHTDDVFTFVTASGLSDVVSIAVMKLGVYALRSDGTVFYWGDGGSSSPTRIDGLTDVKMLGRAVALKNDGTVVHLHANDAPTVVSGLVDVVSVAGQDDSWWAVSSDGSVRAWGANGAGQLGDGTTTDRSTPVPVAGLDGLPVSSVHPSVSTDRVFFVLNVATVDLDLPDAVTAGEAAAVTATVNAGSTGLPGVPVTLSATSNAALGATETKTDAYGRVTTTVTPDVWTRPGSVLRVTASTDSGASSDTARVLGANVLVTGNNVFGQHGDGTTNQGPLAVQMSREFSSPVRNAVSTEYGTTAVLLEDGTVWTVGRSTSGSLGWGSRTPASDMSTVFGQVEGLTDVIQLAAGWCTLYALRRDGSVWGWGYNGYGNLGNGDTNDQSAPVRVQGLSGVSLIAAGTTTLHALAGGKIYGVGWNQFGQLGDGTTTDRTSIVQATGISNAVKIAAGRRVLFALLPDGTVMSCGTCEWGETGQGGPVNGNKALPTPTLIAGLTGVVDIAAHGNGGFAISSDGTVKAWGANNVGQLGDGTTTDRLTPTEIPTLKNARSISGGYQQGFALFSDGSLKGWGDNGGGLLSYGQWGNYTSTPVTVDLGGHPLSTLPVANTLSHQGFFIIADTALSVDVASRSVAAGSSSDVAARVGAGSSGVSGIDVTLTASANAVLANSVGKTDTSGYVRTTVTPDAWTTPGTIVKVTAAAGSASVSDSFRVTGANVVGIGEWLGLGVETGNVGDSLSPVQLRREFTSPIVRMASNRNSAIAVLKDGTVWGMGGNFYRTLKDTDDAVYAWTQVPGVSDAVQVAMTDYTSYALRKDGSVLAWGTGEYELFPRTNGKASVWRTPSLLAGLSGVTQIAAGFGTFYAVMSDGTVRANGWGEVGQFGDGSTTNSNAFVTVPTLAGVDSIATSAVAATALQNDGTVWFWGGGPNTEIAPTKIANIAGAKSIGANVALDRDGAVWQFSFANPATQVAGLGDVVSIASTGGSFYAVLADGSVKAWGANGSGQLGNGSKTDSATPTDVIGLSGHPVTAAFPGIRGGKVHLVLGESRLAVNVASPIAAGSAGAVTAKVASGAIAVAGAAVSLSASGGAVLASSSGSTDSAGLLQTTVTPDVWTRPGASLSVKASSGSSTAFAAYTVLGSNLMMCGPDNQAYMDKSNPAPGTPASLAVQSNPRFPAPVQQTAVTPVCVGVLLTNGTVWTCGGNDYGQAGRDTNILTNWRFGPVTGIKPVTSLVAGWNCFFAIHTDGTVSTWGWNSPWSQLGVGDTANRFLPVPLTGFTAPVVQIYAGPKSALALQDDGSVWVWGQWWSRPARVSLPRKATAVMAMEQSFFMLLDDGTVYSFGNGSNGRQGNGKTDWVGDATQTLTDLPAGSKVVQLAGGEATGYALLSDGSVWGWGWNSNGQVGDGSTVDRLVPVKIFDASSGVKRLAALRLNGSALFDDGTVKSWGTNKDGQVGDGTTVDRAIPTSVTGFNGRSVTWVGSGPKAESQFFAVEI